MFMSEASSSEPKHRITSYANALIVALDADFIGAVAWHRLIRAGQSGRRNGVSLNFGDLSCSTIPSMAVRSGERETRLFLQTEFAQSEGVQQTGSTFIRLHVESQSGHGCDAPDF